jgi:methionine-rich copper-binding protein CopC
MTRRAIVLGLVGVAMLVLAPPAFGHAAYKESSPADESTVSSPPSEVWAEFTEPVTDESFLLVFDPCGRQVDNGDSAPSGFRVTVTMSGGAAGKYRVEFHVISELDGHHTNGDFTFTSTGGEACPGTEAPEEESAGGASESKGGGGAPSETEVGKAGGAKAGGAKTDGGKAASASGSRGREALERRDPSRKILAAERGDLDEIPIDALLWGYAVAALVGAAGGFAYSAILGPPD